VSLGLRCPICRVPPDSQPINTDTLECSGCGNAYGTVADGVPLVVAAQSVEAIRAYDFAPSALSSATPSDHVWDVALRAAAYALDHYGEAPSFRPILDELLPRIDTPVERALDLGCGVGGVALDVARRTGAHVIGVDSNAHALHWARAAATGSDLQIPVRTTAGQLGRRSGRGTRPEPGSVSWVCASATDPPFEVESFALVLLFNLLDSLAEPFIALGQASAVLRPGGYLLLAQPDAWMTHVTPPQNWLAQTSEEWEAVFGEVGLETIASFEGVEWTVRHSDRQRFGYTSHARLARRVEWS